MSSSRAKQILLTLSVNILLAAALIVITYQYNSAANPILQEKAQDGQKKEERRPIAIFSETLPSDERVKSLRQARNKVYDNRNTVPFDKLPAGTTMRFVVGDFWTIPPVLPADESDAIFIGEVIDAKGFLSNDKTGAYSEYSILVQKILKSSNKASVSVGDIITAEREGADVKLPDGRIIEDIIANRGTPQVGNRYALFLRYNEAGEDYRILTGYKIHGGHIYPLDDGGEFEHYKGRDEISFLEEVRKNVIESSNKRRLDR